MKQTRIFFAREYAFNKIMVNANGPPIADKSKNVPIVVHHTQFYSVSERTLAIIQNNSKASATKSSEPGEIMKNVAVARTLPRSKES